MPTITQIYETLQTLAPLDLAAKWDNVGLLVDAGTAPTAVLFALDITPEVVQEAAELGCQLIVSHHPVIFDPLKQLTAQDVPFQLVAGGISAICMHTNLDATDGGVNDVLAGLLGLQEAEHCAEDCGRIGVVEPISAAAFAKKCATVLGTQIQWTATDADKTITKVAVVGGAGGSFTSEIAQLGADAFVTGEAGHHHALDAKRLGLTLLVAGHYATERPVVPVLAQTVGQAFPDLACHISQADQAPLTYL